MRHNSAESTGAKAVEIEGKPDLDHVSMSLVKPQNSTTRSHMRLFTSYTDPFSKSVADHARMAALCAVWHNFARVRGSLRIPPARAAGISDRPWSMDDLAALVEAADVPAQECGFMSKAGGKRVRATR